MILNENFLGMNNLPHIAVTFTFRAPKSNGVNAFLCQLTSP